MNPLWTLCRQLLGLWLGLSWAQLSFAESFETGHDLYIRNQFSAAEISFKNTLKKSENITQKASILKFIGICQFMQGDRKSAVNTFYETLRVEFDASIDSEEVLDPEVIIFFNQVRGYWLSSDEGRAATVRAATLTAEKTDPSKMDLKPRINLGKNPLKSPSNQTALGSASRESLISQKNNEKQTKKNSKFINNPRRNQSTRPLSWRHFMPFGIGQFYNRSYALGGGLAAGQILSLHRSIELTQLINERQNSNRSINQNPEVSETSQNDLFIKTSQFIDKNTKYRDIAIASFVVLYTSSVVDASLRTKGVSDAVHEEKSIPARPKMGDIEGLWLPNKHGGQYQLHWNLSLQ